MLIKGSVKEIDIKRTNFMPLHVSYHTNSAVNDNNFEEEFVGFTECYPVPIIQVHTH